MELNLTAADTSDVIKDGSEASFMADVVEASNSAPVIVDFWAPWCGPCKTLGPALEAEVKAARGKVKMVKIDVDQNQRIAAQLQVQSIPTVLAFHKGQPVDGFMGAQSPSQIKAFVEKLSKLGGDGGDPLAEAITAADEMLAEGAAADAAEVYSAILGEVPGHLGALAGLARTHLAVDDLEKARSILSLVPDDKANDPAIAAIRAQIDLAEASAGTGATADLAARVEAQPDDHQARFDLALALVGEADHAGAVDHLLELFRQDREWNDEAAKTQLFKIFDSLGPKSDIAAKGRRRLTSMIFA